MAGWQSWWQQAQNQWRQMPRSQQLLVLLAILAIGCVTWFSTNQESQRWTLLLADTEIRADDLRRMEIAFAEEGLSDYRFEQGQVWVPAPDRSKYLQAAILHEALPGPHGAVIDTPPTTNLFATREQELAQRLFHQKKRVRDMLTVLPFVDSVRVELDCSTPSSIYQSVQTTCAVSILGKDNLILTPAQVNTVRDIVTAMIASIEADNVVVIDLSIGATISGQPSLTFGVNHHPIDQLRAKQEWQLQLVAALKDYPQIDVELRLPFQHPPQKSPVESPLTAPGPMLEQSPPPQLSTTPVAAASSIPAQPTASSVANGQGSLPNPTQNYQLGSNGQMSLKAMSIASSSTDFRLPSAVAATDPAASVVKPASRSAVDSWEIAIKVPNESLLAFAKSESQWGGAPAANYWSNDRQAIFTRMKTRLQSEIDDVLAAMTSQLGALPTVSFELQPLTDSPQPAWAWSDLIQWFTGKQSGAVLAVTSGLLLLGFVLATAISRRASRKRQQRAGQDQTPELDATPSTIELRQQIDRLIKNDPDTAARVIQQWIRKAS